MGGVSCVQEKLHAAILPYVDEGVESILKVGWTRLRDKDVRALVNSAMDKLKNKKLLSEDEFDVVSMIFRHIPMYPSKVFEFTLNEEQMKDIKKTTEEKLGLFFLDAPYKYHSFIIAQGMWALVDCEAEDLENKEETK
jgi:hypothetical protein